MCVLKCDRQMGRNIQVNSSCSHQKASPFYTNNASQACLFILSLDTLARDPIDNFYVPNIQSYLQEFGPVWSYWAGTWGRYQYLQYQKINLGYFSRRPFIRTLSEYATVERGDEPHSIHPLSRHPASAATL